MKHLLIILIILAASHQVSAQAIGSMAPDFTLKNTSDESFTLSDYKGKVIAVFLLGYACPSCRAIAPSVQSKLIDKFKSNSDFVFVAIDTWDGTTAQVEGFNSATGTTFNILQKGSQVAQSWQTTYDRIVIVDSKGNLAFKGEGLVSTHLDQAISTLTAELVNTATSVSELPSESNTSIDIFPNPVTNQATIRFKLIKSTEVTYSIFDFSGRTIHSQTSSFIKGENSILFDASGLNSGIHFIQLKTGDEVETKKFIVN